MRLLVDEGVNDDIVTGLLRLRGNLDLVRAKEIGLRGTPDPVILEVAAQSGRILVTQDRGTMIGYAYDRVRAGESMAGLWVVDSEVAAGTAIDAILIAIDCSIENEWEGRVLYLP